MNFLRKNATLFCTLTAVLFVAGPALAHIHVIPALVGFSIFVVSVILGAISLISGILLVKSGQLQSGVLVFSVGALPVFITGYSAASFGRFPAINDVSTDLKHPPALIDQRFPGTSVKMSEDALEMNALYYADLAPLHTLRTPEETYEIAYEEVRSLEDWTIVNADPHSMIIQGYVQYGIFQFIDDFTIRVRTGSEGTEVDMRSKSREGKGDQGTNAKRIRGFLASLGNKL